MVLGQTGGLTQYLYVGCLVAVGTCGTEAAEVLQQLADLCDLNKNKLNYPLCLNINITNRDPIIEYKQLYTNQITLYETK